MIPIKVQICRLDSHFSLQHVPKIDLMKVDAEGFEPNVFRGMAKYLQDGRVRYLMCEFNSRWLELNDLSVEEFLKIIQNFGFYVQEGTPAVTVVERPGLVYQIQDILFKH